MCLYRCTTITTFYFQNFSHWISIHFVESLFRLSFVSAAMCLAADNGFVSILGASRQVCEPRHTHSHLLGISLSTSPWKALSICNEKVLLIPCVCTASYQLLQREHSPTFPVIMVKPHERLVVFGLPFFSRLPFALQPREVWLLFLLF